MSPNIFSRFLHRKDKSKAAPEPQRPSLPKLNLISSALGSQIRRLMSIKRSPSRRRSTLLKRSNLQRSKLILDQDDQLLYENLLGDELAASSIHQGERAFDYHHAHETVKFPSLDHSTMNNVSGADSPVAGITYEHFMFPDYVKVHRRHKHLPRIPDLFLAQELNFEVAKPFELPLEALSFRLMSGSDEMELEHPNENLVMAFSKDGQYLAAAGRDHVVRVWKVLLSPLARLEHRNNSASYLNLPSREMPKYVSAPVFHSTPVAQFRGHTELIISLDWSKNNFLLTGSMDKTTKLWHVERSKCLQTFQLQDFVTAVKFHPTDDRFFALGSIDNKLMLWLILEGTVSYERFLDDNIMITTLSFTPDGENIIIGGFNGTLVLTETKGLHTVAQVEIKEKLLVKMGNRNGNKITGIEIFAPPNGVNTESDDPAVKWNFLITTNDSKVRLVTNRKLITRFRGLHNESSSIVALTSDDSQYIISGSEDHYVYIWLNDNTIVNNKIRQTLKELVLEGKHLHHRHQRQHRFYDKLVLDNGLVKKLVHGETGDGKAGSTPNYMANENSLYSLFHPHHLRVNSAIFAPSKTKQLLELSDDIIYDLYKRGSMCNFDSLNLLQPRGREGQRYRLLTITNQGLIIVTTDQTGLIKVYRQDIAYHYRKKFIELYKQCQQRGANGQLCEDMGLLLPSQLTLFDNNKEFRKSLSLRSKLPTNELQKRLSSRLRSRSNGLTTIPMSPLFQHVSQLNSSRGRGNITPCERPSLALDDPFQVASSPPTDYFAQAPLIEQRFQTAPQTSIPIIVGPQGQYSAPGQILKPEGDKQITA